VVTKQAMPAARAVRSAVCGPGEEDLESLRPILAELGMWAINTTDFYGMGIKDPKGKSRHTCDWGSGDGVRVQTQVLQQDKHLGTRGSSPTAEHGCDPRPE
jgi:hypothetical protein